MSCASPSLLLGCPAGGQSHNVCQRKPGLAYRLSFPAAWGQLTCPSVSCATGQKQVHGNILNPGPSSSAHTCLYIGMLVLTVGNNQTNEREKTQTLPIQDRTTPYHQDIKINSVITPASQELVSSFCAAGSAPFIDSIVPKDTGTIMQLQFKYIVL